jgi:O-antigen ligase
VCRIEGWPVTFQIPGVRLGLICLAAASVGLSLAIISISKVLLVLAVLPVLLFCRRLPANGAALRKMWAPLFATLAVFVFALSILWTSAPLDQALGALGKYGKFLVIPALLVLIRTRQEAFYALVFFLGAQAFLMISSWLLYFQIPIPWATSKMARDYFAVFSSYLDQGIMSAVLAAICWHLRLLVPDRRWFYAAIALSLLALGNVFIVFMGRTGYLVGVAVVSLAIFWALPRHYRLASLLVPPLLLLIVFSSSEKIAKRLSAVQIEVSEYSVKPEFRTSSGVRLSLWKTSVEAIAQKPLIGAGAGSWLTEYNRIERLKNPVHQDLGPNSHGNPHQEFLLWGVQLGVGGILLLFAFLGAVLLDLRKMDRSVAWACQSVLLALVVSCLSNSSLYDAYIGDFFCVSLGVLLAYGFYSREEGERQNGGSLETSINVKTG